MSAIPILIFPLLGELQGLLLHLLPAPHLSPLSPLACPPASDFRLAIPSARNTFLQSAKHSDPLYMVLCWGRALSPRPPLFCLNGQDTVPTDTPQHQTAAEYCAMYPSLSSPSSFLPSSLLLWPLSRAASVVCCITGLILSLSKAWTQASLCELLQFQGFLDLEAGAAWAQAGNPASGARPPGEQM